ncbi:MAG: class II aldolase/adducin family protein [Candidatus Sumerlaeaceae bacterium]|nr:class II aldolase/adducin family protein [Candidatus Sumerlaeaceae bacterium]
MSETLKMTPYLAEGSARDALCEIGRRVWQREYIASNDGNFSVLLGPNRVLCTPTMVSKGFMDPAELPVVDLDGKIISGPKPPTSEIRVHLAIYRHRPDVRAVVHVHPPHATAFAVVRRNLPKCILPEVEVFLGEIPLVPYATPGTQEFADITIPYMQTHNAFLLTNHGAITLGSDPFEAYYRMETLEQYCRILILASQLGDLKELDLSAMADLLKLRAKLGHCDRREHLPPQEWCTPSVPPGGVRAANLVTERAPSQQQSASSDPVAWRQSLVEEITRRVLQRLRYIREDTEKGSER